MLSFCFLIIHAYLVRPIKKGYESFVLMATNLDYNLEEVSISEQEQIIKEQLESWIADIYKNTELESRLQKAFENSKSHVQSLSEL